MNRATEASTTTQTAGAASTMVAFLCPDHLIGGLYRDYIAAIPQPVTLILAHGYCVYSGDLKTQRLEHAIALLAPKAIGPQLRKAFVEAKKQGRHCHDLAAGVSDLNMAPLLGVLAEGLGFQREKLVETTAEIEALGDLLSEQGLLCGGLFTLMDWTMEAMEKAGIPGGLTKEECITELLLIVGLIKERGLERTLRSISQAALAGAASMNKVLESSGAKEAFQAQLQRVQSKKFATDFDSGSWRPSADSLAQRLRDHDQALGLAKNPG